MLKNYAIVLIVLLFIYIVFISIKLSYSIKKSVELVKESTSFQREIPNAKYKILVAGDSLSFGVGATTPPESVAGQLGQDFADASVKNVGVSGQRVAGLLQSLQSLPTDSQFDLTVIDISANDVTGFTDYVELEESLKKSLELAHKYSKKVILMTSGDVGRAPIFHFPINKILSHRYMQVREITTRVAQETDTLYLDLYRELENDPYSKNPKLMYARDNFHPSSEGYKFWYGELKKVLLSVELGKE